MTTWFKLSDGAEYARLSADVLRRAIKRGDLKSYAPTPGGKDIRLKASDIDAWIESQPYEPQRAS